MKPDGTIKVGNQDQEWDVKKTELTRYLPRELQPERPVHMFDRAHGPIDKPKLFTGEKPQDQMTEYAKDHDHKCFAAFNHLIAKWEWTDNQDSDVSFDAGRFVEVAVNAYCSFPDVQAMDNFLNSLPEELRQFWELLPESAILPIRFDFDGKSQAAAPELFKQIVERLKTFLHDFFGITVVNK
eukprot:COSAG02_NODE_15921_length_1129_cov_30.792233_1_plen_183_part_00